MLMLGFKASVEKRDISLSGEVDSAKWVKLEEAPEMMRPGSIAQQLVRAVIALK
jgi:NADH pyrophosphatase NudC (nudix superfamily)